MCPWCASTRRTAAGPINWNANGIDTESGYTQDINFNGRTTSTPDGTAPEILAGFDDWANVRLNQVGARRNVGGPFFDSEGRQVLGPLSLDMGRWDFGRWDFAQADLGRWDFGTGDLGRGDLGQGDYGRWDFGRWDFGRWDFGQPAYGRGDEARGYLGGGDLFVGDPNNTGGELDFETAADLAKTPPNAFDACVIGVDCVGARCPRSTGFARAGRRPTSEASCQYAVYRVDGDCARCPEQPWTLVATVDSVPGQDDYSVIDSAPADERGARTPYFTVAHLRRHIQSDPSNLVTITAVNDPPSAGNDSYTVAEDGILNQTTPGVLANDSDADSDGPLTATLRHRRRARDSCPEREWLLHLHAGRELSTVRTRSRTRRATASSESAPATVSNHGHARERRPDRPVADSYTTAEDTPFTSACRRASATTRTSMATRSRRCYVDRSLAWHAGARPRTARSPIRQRPTTTGPTRSPTRPATGWAAPAPRQRSASRSPPSTTHRSLSATATTSIRGQS